MAVINQARRAGANIPTRLNEAQLLWTPQRARQLGFSVLQDQWVAFQGWMPHEYLRTVNRTLTGATPTDMYNGISEWMRSYMEHIGRQPT